MIQWSHENGQKTTRNNGPNNATQKINDCAKRIKKHKKPTALT